MKANNRGISAGQVILITILVVFTIVFIIPAGCMCVGLGGTALLISSVPPVEEQKRVASPKRREIVEVEKKIESAPEPIPYVWPVIEKKEPVEPVVVEPKVIAEEDMTTYQKEIAKIEQIESHRDAVKARAEKRRQNRIKHREKVKRSKNN